MDHEFRALCALASHPLRRGFEDGPPTGSCSGVLVQFGVHRVLLTVSHSVRPEQVWAIELQYDQDQGTKVWKLGPMTYHLVADLMGNVEEVDLAFTAVPDHVRGFYQAFSDTGALKSQVPRAILESDLLAAPQVGTKYGFAGLTRHTSEPKPPLAPHAIAGAELRHETELTYLDTVDGIDRYKLGHPHPGHEFYRGCSGAPVLSEDGDLVGLVIHGFIDDATITSIALRKYAPVIKAALESRANKI